MPCEGLSSCRIGLIHCLAGWCKRLEFNCFILLIFYLVSSSQVIGQEDRFICTSQVSVRKTGLFAPAKYRSGRLVYLHQSTDRSVRKTGLFAPANWSVRKTGLFAPANWSIGQEDRFICTSQLIGQEDRFICTSQLIDRSGRPVYLHQSSDWLGS